ncbi:conserved hypothetical protein [Ricinus communis]|uniref:Uncharacterized protein n=1 Tax=Ricinus communis TaxID=3988 RepID=B9ST77_RICCO|nr:conserved hypothetical protein [Ricinus communis]
MASNQFLKSSCRPNAKQSFTQLQVAPAAHFLGAGWQMNRRYMVVLYMFSCHDDA